MITLHHLEQSRSHRVLWLLEELGVPYKLVRYPRTASKRAPAELTSVHPLGKSPVLTDEDLTLAESSTILRYLDVRYGEGRFSPPLHSKAYWQHAEWLEYVEGSAMLPVIIAVLTKMTGEGGANLDAFSTDEAKKVLDYIESGLGDQLFLMGDQLTLSDIQMSYFLGLADHVALLHDRPALTSYFDRLQAQDGFRRAEELGGPMREPAHGQ